MNKRLSILTTIATTLCLTPLLSQTALAARLAGQVSTASTALDLGEAPAGADHQIVISLALPNRAALEQFVASTVDPASPNYHHFLRADEFAARFGQPQSVVDNVKAQLASQGITVTKVYNNNLVMLAHASNATLANVFGTRIHSFAAGDARPFQRPVGPVVIPAALQGVVNHVAGLSTAPVWRPHHRQVGADLQAGFPMSTTTPPTAGVRGAYSVADLAKQYNITGLTNQGITGAGTTLGIMTFGTFKTSNIGPYWQWAGLADSSTGRITTINVGTGQTNNGEIETTLDVQQSGGVAPGANVRVYVAANDDAGSLALYTQAITENLCDTLSISWGNTEFFYEPADLVPYDALFLQAAAQGTPISAAAGDAGAYDVNDYAYPYPNYSPLLSVDYPSSSPYVVAAGGTTLPVSLNLGGTTVTVPSERPWSTDYQRSYLVGKYGVAGYYANYFPVGGGGGVSIRYPVPAYQQGLPGVVTSAAGQSMYCINSPANTDPNYGPFPCTRGADIVDLPSGFAGRNSPDVALNADGVTGYAIYGDGKWYTGYGGTSFVAPQLNGIFALLTQKLGHRVGWPQPQLYSLFKKMGYGTGSPFRAITTGTNLFYAAAAHYNPATGLGSLDVANLAAALAAQPSPRPAATAGVVKAAAVSTGK